MNWSKGMAGAALTALLAGSLGCEQVALVGRPDVDPAQRAERTRDPIWRGDVQRDEIIGTVERVDRRDREIVLRTTDGLVTTVKYDSSTIVRTQARDMAVEDLRPGDLVALNVERDRRGERYADVIRMRDRDGFGRR